MAHLDINSIMGSAGSYGAWLWGIDAAPALSTNFYRLAQTSNSAQRDCTNFRIGYVRIKSVDWH